MTWPIYTDPTLLNVLAFCMVVALVMVFVVMHVAQDEFYAWIDARWEAKHAVVVTEQLTPYAERKLKRWIKENVEITIVQAGPRVGKSTAVFSGEITK